MKEIKRREEKKSSCLGFRPDYYVIIFDVFEHSWLVPNRKLSRLPFFFAFNIFFYIIIL